MGSGSAQVASGDVSDLRRSPMRVCTYRVSSGSSIPRGSALLILLRHGVRQDGNRAPGATCGDRGAGVWVNAPLTQAGGGATGGKSQRNSVMVLALVGFRFSPWSQDRTL